jgi:hypothetical protein
MKGAIMVIRRLLWLVTVMTLLGMAFSGCGASQYTLSVSSVPAGSGTINPSSGTYEKGVEVVVTASPATGYRFDHWEGAASGNAPTLNLVMNGNKNLKAYFTKTYTLSVSCTPASGGTISPNGGTYDEGTEVTLIATPATYYKFDGWGGQVSGSSNSVTIKMDSDKTVVASFSKASYSLQTQVDPSGGGTINPSSGTYDGGTQVNIVAMPASGYMFDHWAGGISGTSSASTLLIDTNKTITAYFVRAYTLSVSCSPQAGCTVEPIGGLYRAGTKVTLTATVEFPYGFKQWSGTDNDSINPTTVTMNSDKSVIAYSPQMVASAPVDIYRNLWGGGYLTEPIDLKQGCVVQGEEHGGFPNLNWKIVDPAGNTVKEWGGSQANFLFTAQMSGRYTFQITNPSQMYNTAYALTYTIYCNP